MKRNKYMISKEKLLSCTKLIGDVYRKPDDVLFQFEDGVLAFRGTETGEDLLVDLMAFKVPYTIDIPHSIRADAGKVHSGFYLRWRVMRDSVMTEVRRTWRQELTVTGHSLGGAIANLAAIELAVQGYDVQVITFGAPRVGDGDFSRLINHNLKNYARVENHGDPVVRVPAIQGWSHAGVCVNVGSVWNYLKPPYSRRHFMSSYMTAIEQMKGDVFI